MSARSAPSARSVALEVIRRVVEHGAYSNLVLPAALAGAALPASDRNLASELAYGTLRRLLRIDWVLADRLHRPLERTPARALALLRLGAYQLLFTRIPPYAAVSETVALAGPRESGFVNATLRSVAGDPPAWPAGASDAHVSVRTGLAQWAVRELRRQLGREAEEAAGALAERGRLTVRTNTCRTTVAALERALAEAGVEATRGAIHPDSLVFEAGAPRELPGFAEGWFAVQDQASSFVVRALGPRPGESILEVCAGPGGKTGHIACLVSPGGRVVAADVSPKRSALVLEQLSRLGLRALVLAQDARVPALRGTFDRVLVDAPCSGVGSARRRPELLWRPRGEDLPGLTRLQVAVASSATDLVRPGGRLAYSVCTFTRAETDGACDALLGNRPDLEPAEIEGPDGPDHRVRLWPHRHGTDAMFVAAFRRAF
ncbi:MAG: 16S rRNA (cytosine(967)-C(5))-methyltransferase RsmB [Actinomycetota bacterium]